MLNHTTTHDRVEDESLSVLFVEAWIVHDVNVGAAPMRACNNQKCKP
jgi:hypothetical protein